MKTHLNLFLPGKRWMSFSALLVWGRGLPILGFLCCNTAYSLCRRPMALVILHRGDWSQEPMLQNDTAITMSHLLSHLLPVTIKTMACQLAGLLAEKNQISGSFIVPDLAQIKREREKMHTAHRDPVTGMMANFSPDTTSARRQWNIYLKCWQRKKSYQFIVPIQL